MAEMKEAMKSKDEAALRGLRAIKAEIIKAKTEPGAGGEIDEATEQKFLVKMMKQRRDSLEIFEKQGREDLATKEKEEMRIIEKFLPKQLSESEIKEALKFEFENIEKAIEREKQIKKWSRKKKEALINTNYDKLKEYAKKKWNPSSSKVDKQ